MKNALVPLLFLCATPVVAQQPAAGPETVVRNVNPTFLRRFVPNMVERSVALTSPSAHYFPVFGDGDSQASVLRTVSRYGKLRVDANGSSARVKYPREEHILVVLEGGGSVSYSGQNNAVKANDFLYVPPDVEFGVSGGPDGIAVVVMGFKIPDGMTVDSKPASMAVANIDDVGLVTVPPHPESTLYRLLMGDTTSTRDRLATAHVVTSLYTMEFAPGGTNFPHNHETAEEIYLLLDGNGEMVAGSGMDGVEGKYPAFAGDAYFFRQNATVGFYNSNVPGSKPARILAVRSLMPPDQRIFH